MFTQMASCCCLHGLSHRWLKSGETPSRSRPRSLKGHRGLSDCTDRMVGKETPDTPASIGPIKSDGLDRAITAPTLLTRQRRRHVDIRSHTPVFHNPRRLQEVRAEDVSASELEDILKAYVQQAQENAWELRMTLKACLDLLMSGEGGLILIVLDKGIDGMLQYKFIDEGRLLNCFRRFACNIHSHSREFCKLVGEFSHHGTSDRWTHQELQTLATSFRREQLELSKLKGYPKDGAIILSHSGTVLAAAVHLLHTSSKWELVRSNGNRTGTRHGSTLATTEVLTGIHKCAVSFVRSDDGGMHVFLPPRGSQAVPRILFVQDGSSCRKTSMHSATLSGEVTNWRAKTDCIALRTAWDDDDDDYIDEDEEEEQGHTSNEEQ